MTLQGLVAHAYPTPEWAVFFEVSNATGFGARRRADAVAIGIWPSRGHTLVGFEFKADRRDWLREKQHPEKADVIAAHCDLWYVVASDDAVVKAEELPEPWGLLVANKDQTKLVTKKPAVPFPDRDKSIVRRSFAAAMLRKVSETTVPRVELDRIVEERVKMAVENTVDGRRLKHLEEQNAHLHAIVDGFKEATGVNLQDWRGPKKIAAAVNAVLNLESDRHALDRTKRQLERAARDLAAVLDDWPVTSVTALEEQDA